MKALLGLAARSAWNRRATLALVVASIALATLLLLSFDRARSDIRDSFRDAISGTDLVVGARSSPVQLMLYAVFRIGGATNNVRMSSVHAIAAHPSVAWVVPLSLGDSFRGFPVMGTTTGYFEHLRYGDRRRLVLEQGRVFGGDLDRLYEAVLGAEVARATGHRMGDRIALSHGSGPIEGADHADKPFTVVGVLAATGTPVDRTVHVSLEAIEALHVDWAAGAPLPGLRVAAEHARKFDLAPKAATAALVGLHSRPAAFVVQRHVGAFQDEPLMAVLPGVALDELWNVVGVGENLLLGLSAIVAVVSLAGLVAVVLAGLNERRRELAVLRAVGAGPRHVLLLLAAEGALVTLLGALLGALMTALLIAGAAPWIRARYGIDLRLAAPEASQWALFASVVATGWLASLLPAWRAYRLSLADGLSPRT